MTFVRARERERASDFKAGVVIVSVTVTASRIVAPRKVIPVCKTRTRV